VRYEGKLYGKVARRCIPLILTSQDVDKLESDRADLLEALEGIASATCEKWEMPYADFKEQFMPWARNVALAALKKVKGGKP
jgi:hypothetical protein